MLFWIVVVPPLYVCEQIPPPRLAAEFPVTTESRSVRLSREKMAPPHSPEHTRRVSARQGHRDQFHGDVVAVIAVVEVENPRQVVGVDRQVRRAGAGDGHGVGDGRQLACRPA